MNKIIVLFVLYITFISLGLPDQVLGVAWPYMRLDYLKTLDYAGVLTFIVTIFTAISGYASGYVISKMKMTNVVVFSILLIILGTLGYAYSNQWLFVVLSSIPLGLGAGSIDSALNNYASINLSSRAVNFLHGFWGVGATLGPLVFSTMYAFELSYRKGYIFLAVLQLLILIVFLLFKKYLNPDKDDTVEVKTQKMNIIGIDTFLSSLFFFLYVALEMSVGLWYYSYLVEFKSYEAASAGFLIAFYWASLTLGRFLVGALTKKMSDKTLITLGISLSFLGLALLYFNIYLIGLIIIGLSLAGLYPCMINITHSRFETKVATVLMGHQVGSAALGAALLVPLIGFILQKTVLSNVLWIFFALALGLFLIDLRLRRLN